MSQQKLEWECLVYLDRHHLQERDRDCSNEDIAVAMKILQEIKGHQDISFSTAKLVLQKMTELTWRKHQHKSSK